jgi:site-specific recombinase XerC
VLEINKKNGFEDEDYLFLGEKGERIHIRAVDNRIRKLCKRAGIEPAKSAHDIRRTVATQTFRNNHRISFQKACFIILIAI